MLVTKNIKSLTSFSKTNFCRMEERPSLGWTEQSSRNFS